MDRQRSRNSGQEHYARRRDVGKVRLMFTVLYHSLLIGAALFVPIPFLDDRMATFLWKHMVSDLAKIHKRELLSVS